MKTSFAHSDVDLFRVQADERVRREPTVFQWIEKELVERFKGGVILSAVVR
jgi:hypothetical protein